MTRPAAIFLLFIVGCTLGATAQEEDPSEIFLKAYMTAQQGEKFEQDKQFKAALGKFRAADSLLKDLRKSHANWQPAIVEYRESQIVEAIERINQHLPAAQRLRSTPSVPRTHQGGVGPRTRAAEDPSELFLKAYMTAQQGEKLVQDNQFEVALGKFRVALDLMEKLRKRYPKWQPSIVKYRQKRIAASLARLENRVTESEGGAPSREEGSPKEAEHAPPQMAEVISPTAESTSAAKISASFPTALAVPEKPGFVTSPFYPYAKGIVDVKGLPAGTAVRCPYTQKVFIVP